MKFSLFVNGFLFLALLNIAHSDEIYITELQNLLRSLPLKDPSRVELTSRLADAYFQEAIQGKKKYLAPALREYESYLSQTQSEASKTKIEFQIARLKLESGDQESAKQLFRKLSLQTSNGIIQRESALRVAEILDQSKNSKDENEATEKYKLVLQLCNGGDVCSYARYRLAWLHYRSGKLELALKEIRDSLVDSKGQVREESLRDFMMMLSQVPGDGMEQLAEIEALSTRFQRMELPLQFSQALFASGNKIAGTNTLFYLYQKNPKYDLAVKLLEETYGLRQWTEFKEILSQLTHRSSVDTESSEVDQKNSEQIFRRLLIQLDGERVTQPDRIADFQESVENYIKFYPKSDLNLKMVQGWMSSEKDSSKKIEALTRWMPLFSGKEEVEMRKSRVALAKKEKKWDLVIQDTQRLIELLKGSSEERELRYFLAKSYYDSSQTDLALQSFSGLTSPEKEIDLIAIQSRNLSLDIYNQRKNYKRMVELGDLWKSQNQKSKPGLEKENQEIQKIVQQAKFEYAVSLEVSSEALQLFKNYCFQGEFLPQSCKNAEILAVKLKDQKSLLSLLEHTEQTTTLVSEYEVSGEFEKAARIREKNASYRKTLSDLIKTALLYELSQKWSDRNRVIQDVEKFILKNRSMNELEPLVFQTLNDAGMIRKETLVFPWSPLYLEKVAVKLEELKLGNQKTKELLLSSKQAQGNPWSKYVLSEVFSLYEKQKKLNFYGKQSQTLFKKRVSTLVRLKQFSDEKIQIADGNTRIAILSLLVSAYDGLSVEISSTPLPEGLDQTTVENLKKSLVEMAEPFRLQALQYKSLADQEVEKEVIPDLRAKLDSIYQNPEVALMDVNQKLEETKQNWIHQALSRLEDLEKARRDLMMDPSNRASILQLKTIYQEQGFDRLSSYFSGRLQNQEGSVQ